MPSFGEELRRERELRQISLREISEVTKINIRYLEALERNEFDRLPGGVFNKGFVRAYSEFIGVDPEGMVNAYLLEEQGQDGRPGQPDTDLMRGELFTKPESEYSEKNGSRWKLLLIGGAIIAAAAFIAIVYWQLGTVHRVEETAAPVGESETDPASAMETLTREGTGSTDEPEHGNQSPETGDTASSNESETISAVQPARAIEPGMVIARVILERATTGKINCDNRRVTILEGLPTGTTLDFECRNFLVIDAADGGALRLGMYENEPASLGADGEPVTNFRILPTTTVTGGKRGDID